MLASRAFPAELEQNAVRDACAPIVIDPEALKAPEIDLPIETYPKALAELPA